MRHCRLRELASGEYLFRPLTHMHARTISQTRRSIDLSPSPLMEPPSILVDLSLSQIVSRIKEVLACGLIAVVLSTTWVPDLRRLSRCIHF